MIKRFKIVEGDGNQYYEYELICDKCGHEWTAHTFSEAVEKKKEIRFMSFKKGDKWYEVCNKCRKDIEAEHEHR